jgi:hypothetical protein
MTAPAFVSVQSVRDYLELNSPGSTSKYSDPTIGSNIRAASGSLERATGRFFADRPGATYTFTTEGRAQFYIPGIRNVTTVNWQGSAVTFSVPPLNSGAAWFLPDVQQSGLYTGLQMRVFRSQGQNSWLANPQWFDMNLDSPYHPANRGGGVMQHTVPNDLTITGDWGYADADLPEPLLHATKVLAAFYTMRPASILADVAITPAGGVLTYSQSPAEVRDFIEQWRIGDQAVLIQ